MKKLSLFFIAFFCFAIHLFAQVKNNIPVIKPVLYEKTKETFENIAQKFEQKNYNELAAIFRSFAMGGHGSGFVFVDADGENYIITNRHVVANSEFVNLEFAGKGSTKIVYESCPIIYTDDDIDLAIVKFPDHEKVFEKSFAISNDKQSDGKEIWSAGFPGLLGKPMWQFAKGNITNEEAYVDQLVAPDVSYLIQHSASIDPGNSGGPLLVKNANDEDYSVIGINTWTITNRQNTFFSIPSKNIPKLIIDAKKMIALKSQKDSLKYQLERQARLFSAEINSDKPNWSKVMSFVSYAYVGNKGWESFINVLDEADPETLKLLENKFFAYSPIEAMRYSILYRIWRKLYYMKDKLSVIEFKGINISDEEQLAKAKSVRTNFLINGIEQEIEWSFEHGHWRISNYDLDKSLDKKSETNNSTTHLAEGKKADDDYPFYVSLDLLGTPYTFSSNSTLNKNFNPMGIAGSLNMIINDRIGLLTRVNSLSFNNKMKNPPATLTEASIKYLHISHGVILYMGSGKKLYPYFLAGFCYMKYSETGKYETLSKTNQYERLGSQFGFGLKYKVNKRVGIIFETSYYSDAIIPAFIEEDLSYDEDLSNLQVSVGISFDLKRK